MSKEIYIVIADLEEGLEWQEYLVRSTAVCPNYKTAYRVGISITGIAAPLASYRTSLEKLKLNGAVKVEGEERKSFTVVRTKFIKYF